LPSRSLGFGPSHISTSRGTIVRCTSAPSCCWQQQDGQPGQAAGRTTLAQSAKGGAHQSVITLSIGLEQPGCVSYEPAFALDAEWTLLACLARLGRPDGSSAYLRLSTRPVD
jgi:pyruvate dehydrogenase complex dehydrogenase (E1) component